MKKQRILFAFIALVTMMVLAGCLPTNPIGTNHAPEITTTEPDTPYEIQVGQTVDLSVAATDEDGDDITFAWTKTGGTLNSTSGDVVEWTAPNQAGNYTVTVKASDGKATDSHTWNITVKNEVPSTVVHVTENYITVPTTWETGKIYVLDEWVQVQNILTIQPGVIVKFAGDFSLTVSDAGTIKAGGTSTAPIIFTSINDDVHGGDTAGDGVSTPGPKDWDSISVNNVNGSYFDYCQFYYGGSRGIALDLNDTKTRVNNCVFAENNGENWGVLFAGDAIAGAIITNNVFYNNIQPLTVSTNISIDDSNVFHNPANAAETNKYNSIMIRHNYITTAIQWKETEVPFVMDGWKTIESGGSLTLVDDVVIKFPEDADLNIAGGGTLNASASSKEHAIVFTSIKDDIYKGDTNADGNLTTPDRGEWGSISISNNGYAVINNCIITYAGYNDDSALSVDASKATITNSTIAHNDSGTWGAVYLGDALKNTVFQNNVIFDNEKPLVLGTQLNIDNTNTFHNPENVSQKNDYNGIFLEGNYVDSSVAWNENELPYVVENWLSVEKDYSLSLGANVIVKFKNGGTLYTYGANVVQGANVVFTSYKDDARGGDTDNDTAVGPMDGDWDGVYDNFSDVWLNWSNVYYAVH